MRYGNWINSFVINEKGSKGHRNLNIQIKSLKKYSRKAEALLR